MVQNRKIMVGEEENGSLEIRGKNLLGESVKKAEKILQIT